MRSELVDSQLLDYFEQVSLFDKLSFRVVEQKVLSLFLGSTTAADFLVEAPE